MTHSQSTGRFKPRGRFDIVVVLPDAYLRYTSDRTRSLTPPELAAAMRRLADEIEGIGGRSAADVAVAILDGEPGVVPT